MTEIFDSHRIIKPLFIHPNQLKYETVQDFIPEMRMVDPATLWVDDKYQRSPSEKSTSLIRKIVATWSWEHFKPPIVTEYEGRLMVIDGQHTSIAAVTHPDIKLIPIFVVPIASVQDAAKAFIAHNTNRTTVNPIQLFKARLEAGEDSAISINMALQRANVTLVQQAGLIEREGVTASLGKLEQIFDKYGLMRLRQTLDICVASKLAPIQAYHLYAVSELMFGTGGYDAQNLALTLRAYDGLAGDAQTERRRFGRSLQEAAKVLIHKKYVELFGDPK